MSLRNYGTVQRAEVGGAVFLLGWIPRFKLQELLLGIEENEQAARRRALLALRAEHLADGQPPPSDVEIWDRMYLDPGYVARLVELKSEVVGWGVRGHEGLMEEGGAPVPFEAASRDFHGTQYAGASGGLVARYVDAGFLRDLYAEVVKRNTIDVDAKKNSPPPSPSEPSQGGGPAGTA